MVTAAESDIRAGKSIAMAIIFTTLRTIIAEVI